MPENSLLYSIIIYNGGPPSMMLAQHWFTSIACWGGGNISNLMQTQQT